MPLFVRLYNETPNHFVCFSKMFYSILSVFPILISLYHVCNYLQATRKTTFFLFYILMIHMILVIFWRLSGILFKNIGKIAIIVIPYHFTYFVYFVPLFEQILRFIDPQTGQEFLHRTFQLHFLNSTLKYAVFIFTMSASSFSPISSL